jgi:hypothetical protein
MGIKTIKVKFLLRDVWLVAEEPKLYQKAISILDLLRASIICIDGL